MTSQQPDQPHMPAAPQPMVLVVNPVPALDPRNQWHCRQAYLNRGAQFSNGCRCYLPHIIVMCSLGGFLFFIGLSIITMGVPSGFMLVVVGAVLLGMGLYLTRAAKRQFNNLPPDHPDRTKYTARAFSAGVGSAQTPVVYTVPPMQNQVMSYPPTTGAQQMYLVPLPPGSYPRATPGMEGGQVPLVAPPGHSPHRASYVPENDPPPPYSDVVHNV